MNFAHRLRSPAALAVATCWFAAPAYSQTSAPPLGAKLRVVNCDQTVPSSKRGVCANALSEADFRALASGVSWFYNWHFETKDKPPAGVPIDFVPMAWGDRPADLAGLQSYLSSTPKKPRVVLAINEPNLRGQAFIPPDKTAALYRKIKDIADRYGVQTVGPHMALGSGANESIKAMDPVEHKEVTYTFMVPFLKAFDYYLGGTPVTATAFHSYGALGELKWATGMMQKEFNKPVWVTEYAQWNSGGADNARKYLIQATDFLERTPNVAGYAWFKERVDKNPNISLFEGQPGKLTPLGEAYVKLPSHDSDIYYRLPGRLQAENYVTLDKMEIQPTKDVDGFAHMAAESPQATLDYNVQVDLPGTFKVKVRIGGPAGLVQISRGPAVLAQFTPPEQGGWQTVETAVPLGAGPQTIRVTCEKSNQAINWFEFGR